MRVDRLKNQNDLSINEPMIFIIGFFLFAQERIEVR